MVLDASAAVEFLLGTRAGAHVVRRIGPDETVHVPHLFDLEIAQALRRLSARRELASVRATQALTDLRDFRAFRYGHEALLPRVWQLRGRMTAYDAAYVALAEALEAPLVTRDARLASAGGHRAEVELVEG